MTESTGNIKKNADSLKDAVAENESAIETLLSAFDKVSKAASDAMVEFGKIEGFARNIAPYIKNISGAGEKSVTALGLVKTAASDLFAVLAANPIVTVGAAIGVLVASLAAYEYSTSQAYREQQELNRKIEETKAALKDYNDTMSKLAEDRQKTISEGQSEIGYYQSLKKELDGIVDSNGKIKEGYEDRASFISETLGQALGTEIQITNGVIENYDKLSDSIDQVIRKKEAEAICNAYQAEYEKAIKSQLELQKKKENAIEAVAKAEKELENAQKIGSESRIRVAEAELNSRRDLLNDSIEAEAEALETRQGFEELNTLFIKGEYDEIVDTYGMAGNALKNLTSLTQEETQKRIDAETYGLEAAKRKYEETGDEIYKNQMDMYQGNIDALNGHLDSITGTIASDTRVSSAAGEIGKAAIKLFNNARFDSAGEEAIEGIKNGMNSKLLDLCHATENIALSLVSTMQKKLKINSPSKVMRDKVGVSIPEGVAVGIEEGIPNVIRAAGKITSAVIARTESNVKVSTDSLNLLNKVPAGIDNDRIINLTTYTVLDGKIISKSVQKDIGNTQTAAMRMKGVSI